MKKIGMIGVGNMGGAILRGMIASGYVAAEDVMACLHSEEKRQELEAEIPGWTCTTDAKALAQECRMIVLAVKPQVLGELLDSIKGEIKDRALVSIAAGWTMDMLTSKVAGTTATLLRVMPNTPALVGEGYTAFCEETTFNGPSLKWAKGLFSCLGMVHSFPESLFDAVVATTSSSPAYVYMFIEAMADGAVKLGLPRKVAIQAAAQAVLGSAKMVLCSGEHPAQLKDNVCSPAGTTIEAVGVLEKSGFRGIIMNAMDACAQKNRKFAQAYERRKNER